MSRHKLNLRILATRQGGYRFYLDGLYVNGKRRRIFFKSERAAKLELLRLTHIYREQGRAGLAISETVRGLAVDCTGLWARYPVQTIRDATRFYVPHLDTINSSVSVEQLIRDYLKTKHQARLSSVHLADIEHRLRRFQLEFGGRAVRAITSAELSEWLHRLALSPTSINNFRSCVRSLFRYALDHGLCDRNPIAAIGKVKVVDPRPVIFTPEALRALLGASPGDLLPLLAIGAFAGLRTAELLRLEWSEINLDRALIEVTALKAKSAKRRLVKILPNLAQWLGTVGRHGKGRVYSGKPEFYHKEIRALCRVSGVKWQDDGFRHSYASHQLAQFEDSAALSLQMGHTNSRTGFENYREMVTPDAAELYWSIRPEGSR